jgi:hypothetical protein
LHTPLGQKQGLSALFQLLLELFEFCTALLLLSHNGSDLVAGFHTLFREGVLVLGIRRWYTC